MPLTPDDIHELLLTGDALRLARALRFAASREEARAAHFALVALGEPAVPALMAYLKDDLTERGQRAWWTLIRIGQPAGADLADCARFASAPAARAAAVWVLAHLRDRSVDRHLVRALDDPDPQVQLPATLMLGYRRCPEAVPALLRVLTLGRYDDPRAPHPDQLALPLPDMFLFGEVTSDDAGECEKSRPPEPSPQLYVHHDGQPADDLEICLSAMGDDFGDADFSVCASCDEFTPSWVVRPWHHWSATDVREAAALSLARICDPRAVESLAACALDEDEPVSLRRMAIMALGCVGDERGFDAVYAALRDDDLRDEAFKSLGVFADRRALQPLLRGAFSADYTRYGAINGLCLYKDPAVLPHLHRLVEDDDTLVVRYAVEGLARLGSQAALERLAEQLTHGDPEVRLEAAEWLRQAQDWREASRWDGSKR